MTRLMGGREALPLAASGGDLLRPSREQRGGRDVRGFKGRNARNSLKGRKQ